MSGLIIAIYLPVEANTPLLLFSPKPKGSVFAMILPEDN